MKSLLIKILTLGSLCLSTAAASAAGNSPEASACKIPDQTVRTFLYEAKKSSGKNETDTLQISPAELESTRTILCQAADLVKSRRDLKSTDRISIITFWGVIELEVNEVISKFIEF